MSLSASSRPPLRVLVADDSEPVRYHLAETLSALDGVSVVAQAADGVAALHEIEASRPDVVILDLHMPRMSGLNALRVLNETGTRPTVIVLSNETAEVYRTACREAGAAHVFDKTTEIERVEAALLRMARAHGVA